MISSLKEASHSLRRSPVFTITAVLSVGLAIGVTCSIFAVVQAVFFTRLPYPEPDRLVELRPTESPESSDVVDRLLPVRMEEWVGSAGFRFLEGVSGTGFGTGLVLRGPEGPARVGAEVVIGDWFGTMGVAAARGRILAPEDLVPGAPPAAVVSNAFARERLSGGLGTIRLSETSYDVVGVMPRSFASDEKVWVPLASLPADARPVGYVGVARLKPGATVFDARREIQRLAALQVARDSARYAERGATARRLAEVGRGTNKPSLWMLTGVVLAVLFVGLGNLASLFLVRAQARRATLAVRASLGASRWQLGQGLMAEGLLVGLGGSVLGVILSFWGTDMVVAYLRSEYLFPSEPAIGPAVITLAVVLGVLVSVLVGVEPMRRLPALDLRDLLQRGAGTTGSTRGERWTRNLLVGAQITVTLVLVAAAAVLWSAHRTYAEVDLGYDAEQVVEAIPDYPLAGLEGPEQWALARRVLGRLQQRPGISGATAWRVVGEDYPPRPENDAVMDGPPRESASHGLYHYYEVGPDFFRTMGVEIVQGRPFRASDERGGAPVAVVTRRGAEAWWPGDDPIGHQVKLGQAGTWMTVVGIAEDIHRLDGLGRVGGPVRRPRRLLFMPAGQFDTLPVGWRTFACCEGVMIAARASSSTSEAARALRSELARQAPGLPVDRIGTMQDVQMETSVVRAIAVTGKLVTAGMLVVLLLALVGIGGVVAEALTRRTREIGVRIALGARAHQVAATVARESVLTALAGVGAGVLLIAGLHEVLRTLFFSYSVSMLGPGVFAPKVLGFVTAMVLLLALGAALGVAARATSVNPVQVLRSE